MNYSGYRCLYSPA